MPIINKNKGKQGHSSKLDKTELVKPNKVDLSFSQMMIQQRLARKWNRKDLALKSFLSEKIIIEY